MKITPIIYSRIATNNVLNHNTNVSVPINQYKQINELSNAFYYPVNFTAKTQRTFETTKPKLKERSCDFLISKIPDIPCPACGKKMLNRTKYEQIADELAKVPKEEYLYFLSNYYDYMRPVEASVYREICQVAQKNGDTTDIRELLVSLRDTKLPILQEAQMRLVNKMTALAKSLPEDEKKALLSKIAKLKKEIKRKNATAPFRRKIMLDRISKVKIKNPKKYEKLQRIAKNFPTSSDMNSAWIVKYSGKDKHGNDWDSYSIALRFLESSIANTDHIIAYGIDNTHDDITNYISMHKACNTQKENKSFLQWLYEDKANRIKYLTDYFDNVNELIETKKIKKKKYKNYVAYATETIYEASKGQLNLTERYKKK